MRMRVVTPEGVLVVFDAASPQDGDDNCSGYLAYWLSTPDRSRFIFPGVLNEPSDLATPLLALERDLGVDLEALADADDRVGQALIAPGVVASDDPAWEPATIRRAVEIMGFDPEDDPDLDLPDHRQTAQQCTPENSCGTASPEPPGNCDSPSGLARNALAVADGCCPGDGGGGGGGGGGDDGGGSGCVPCCCFLTGNVALAEGLLVTATECCLSNLCDDGNVCTEVDLCGPIEGCLYCGCCGTVPKDCDDAIPCTIDGCDPVTGCTHTPRDWPDDVDCDGIPNGADPDVDGDEIANGSDPDVDGDGIPNGSDEDVDADGIPNGSDPDVDGDGLSNHDDGVIDGDGSGNRTDTNIDGDGSPNAQDNDDDADGTPDSNDPSPGGCDADCPAGCCIEVCCQTDLVCCGETDCCDPQFCCDNGECCAQECEECLDNGSLSGGTIDVQPPVVCVDGTITWASSVTDSGGSKRLDCVETNIPPGAVTYEWTLILPPSYPPPLPPLTGPGDTVNVVAKVPGVYSCSFVAKPARTECPPADLPIGSITAEAVHVEVTPAHVDATDPHAAKVWYHVDPHDVMLQSATFSAPGTTQTAENLGTDFYFTFDQSNLPTGASQIRLTANISEPNCTVTAGDVTATRTPTHAPPNNVVSEIAFFKVPVDADGVPTIVTIPVLHSIYGQFAFICYSVPVVSGSKTLWVGSTLVNIETTHGEGIPTEIAAWTERSLYRNIQGDYLEQTMTPAAGPTIPPQTLNFRSADSNTNEFFAPNENLSAIGRIDIIVFQEGENGDPVFPIPMLSINTEVDLALEANSGVTTTCP